MLYKNKNNVALTVYCVAIITQNVTYRLTFMI